MEAHNRPTKTREFRHLLAPRVSHLDAQYLDAEIHDLLKTNLLDSLRYTGLQLYTKLEPEVDALLRWLVASLTIVRSRTSVGQQLLQMKYSDTVSRRVLSRYTLVLVFFPWLQKRCMDIVRFFIKDEDERIAASLWVNRVEVVYKIFYVVNLLVFLREGYYSTLEERLYELRPVPTVPPHLRQISFSFFSRELLWNSFAELLGSVLPLIPTQKFHSAIKSFLPNRRQQQNQSSVNTGETAPLSGDASAVLSQDVRCMVCGDPPVIPYQYGCRHLSCYYCLTAQRTTQREVRCSLCEHELEDEAQVAPVPYVQSL